MTVPKLPRVWMLSRSPIVLLVLSIPVLTWPLASQSIRTRKPFGSAAMCAAGAAGPLIRVRFDPPPPGGELGPLTSCDSSGVTMGPYAGDTIVRTVPAERIRRVDVRSTASTAGAVWGAVMGAVAGFTFSRLNTHLCATGQSTTTATSCHGNVVSSAAIGMGAGIGIGWFFGRGMPRWKVIYQAYSGDSGPER